MGVPNSRDKVFSGRRRERERAPGHNLGTGPSDVSRIIALEGGRKRMTQWEVWGLGPRKK